MSEIATSEQIAICNRFGSAVIPLAPNLKIGIALATMDKFPITAIRHRGENGTCGWYVWGGEYSSEDDFYQALHLAHIQKYCPQIVPYLALAPGWGVMLAPGFEDVWFDESLILR